MQVETTLNGRVTHGLRAQFNQARVDAVLRQANAMFQEAQSRSGVSIETIPETYELFEGGWIDRALEFLGFGSWCIGRPKLTEPVKVRSFRYSERSVSTPSPQTQIHDISPLAVETIFERLLPGSFRLAHGVHDNAIEYRNVMIMGSQGSGKTTLAQTLAISLGRKYGEANVLFALQVGGIDALLNYATRQPSKIWFLVGEDLTLTKIPRPRFAEFFQVRHLIQERTGLNRGLAITVFNSHTFHGREKNLRDTFNMLILKSVPTNPFDRSILKRYFDPWLLDEYSHNWAIDKCLVWSASTPHGAIAIVGLPSEDAIENVTVRRSIWSRLFGH